MNISERLLAELSRKNTDYIAHYIGSDQQKFEELMELLFNGTPPIPQRAAWVVSTIADKYPQLCIPYLQRIIVRLEDFEHTGIHRCLLRFLAETDIPEPLQGQLYDICYKWLVNKHTPIAVKVHCMQILYNIAENEPDLQHELRLIVEELTHHESPAILSRSRYLMGKLGE
jgi:hypothetical protein